MKFHRFKLVLLSAVVFVAMAGSALSATQSPQWMPGFPMRMATNVMLMWTPVPGATEYKVMRAEEGGAPAEIMKGAANNYMDMNVPGEKTFIYTVIAIAGGSPSAPSPAGKLLGQKPIDPPAGLAGRKMGEVMVVRWSVVSGGSFYNIYKKKKGAADFALLASVQEGKYSDSEIEEGKTYIYQVTAVSAMSKESKPSEPYEIEVEKTVVVKAAKQFDFKGIQIERTKELIGEDGYNFRSPGDLIIDEANGRMLVSDFNGYIQVLDLEGEFVQRLAEKPFDYEGAWGVPVGIALDPDGNIWSAWFNPAAVRLFDPTGELLGELEYGATDDIKEKYPRIKWGPGDVTVDGQGRIWVADGGLRQIIVFTGEGDELFRIGSPLIAQDDPDYKLKTVTTPGFLYTSPDGENVVLLENATSRIKIFDMEGKLLRIIAGQGPSLSHFAGVRGLFFSDDGNLLATDGLGNMIKAIDYENGDYYHSYINNMKDKKYDLEPPGAIGYIRATNRLLIVNGANNKISYFQIK